MFFVDFQKAYDSIDRGALYTILKSFQISKQFISLIIVTTGDSTIRVRVGNELSHEFPVITGLKQGDSLSLMLFNLVLEYVLRRLLALACEIQLNGTHKVTGYADDFALLGESREYVAEAAGVLEEGAQKVGLKINHNKRECLHMKQSVFT